MTGQISSYFVGVKGGLVMSLIAFSIVFIVIIGLMLIMMSIKYMAAAIDGKSGGNGNKAVDVQKPAAPAASPASSAPVKAVAASEDEGELLAVISAAITAMCGSAARVVAFSPVVQAPAITSWKFASRIGNREGFQD